MKKFFFVILILILTSDFSFATDSTEIKRLDNKINSLQPIVNQLNKKCVALEKKLTKPRILKEFERIAEDVYNRKYKKSDRFIHTIMWLVTILLGIFAIVSSIFGVYYIKLSKDKYNEEISNFKTDVDKKFNEEVLKIEKGFSNKLRETRAEFYYQTGMSFLRKENYTLAIEYFDTLYESKIYRFEDVVYHLAECNLFIAGINPDKILSGEQKPTIKESNNDYVISACKYLIEAKESTKDKNKLMVYKKLLEELDC